jgi:hypothetical protein
MDGFHASGGIVGVAGRKWLGLGTSRSPHVAHQEYLERDVKASASSIHLS